MRQKKQKQGVDEHSTAAVVNDVVALVVVFVVIVADIFMSLFPFVSYGM